MARVIGQHAEDALTFLKSRETFWDQVESSTKQEPLHQLNNMRLKQYFDEKSREARDRMPKKKKKSIRPDPKPAGARKWRMVYKTHRWTTGFKSHADG